MGSYQSPYIKDRLSLSPKELNSILLNLYQCLKVNDKIVSASSLCQVIETKFNFISSNGSKISQEFLMFEFDLSATAADGTNQQTRTFGGMRGTCRQVGMEYFDKNQVYDEAKELDNKLWNYLMQMIAHGY